MDHRHCSFVRVVQSKASHVHNNAGRRSELLERSLLSEREVRFGANPSQRAFPKVKSIR